MGEKRSKLRVQRYSGHTFNRLARLNDGIRKWRHGYRFRDGWRKAREIHVQESKWTIRYRGIEQSNQNASSGSRFTRRQGQKQILRIAKADKEQEASPKMSLQEPVTMKKCLLTVKNTGCGLGDMLGRIDLVYRITQYLDIDFAMPEVRSNLHGTDYGELFGLAAYHPHIRDYKDSEIQEVPLTIFKDSHIDIEKMLQSEGLVEVIFEHKISQSVYNSLALKNMRPLDYSSYLTIERPGHADLDYLVHLRLGDSYMYKLENGMCLDSRRRRVVDSKELDMASLSSQWDIDKVLDLTQRLEKDGKSYVVICDGVDSAIKNIRWTNTEDYARNRDELMHAVRKFDEQFVGVFERNPNVRYGSRDDLEDVQNIFRAKCIIRTTGGFASHINKFWNNERARVVDFATFWHESIAQEE